jgi:hypothetical protein
MPKILFALFLLGLPACGGHVIYAAGDAGEGSNPGNANSPDDAGGGPGSPFPVCPGVQPQPGSACPTQNQGCAYVDLKTGSCQSWTCDAHNQWESSTPAGC